MEMSSTFSTFGGISNMSVFLIKEKKNNFHQHEPSVMPFMTSLSQVTIWWIYWAIQEVRDRNVIGDIFPVHFSSIWFRMNLCRISYTRTYCYNLYSFLKGKNCTSLFEWNGRRIFKIKDALFCAFLCSVLDCVTKIFALWATVRECVLFFNSCVQTYILDYRHLERQRDTVPFILLIL